MFLTAPCTAICLAVLLTLTAPLAVAGEADADADTTKAESDVPEFVSNRKQIPEELLDRKNVGTYLIGFPIIGYDPDTLFNFGAAADYFNNGPKDSPFFRYNAYQSKTSIAGSASTGGASQLRLKFDMPNYHDSPWHLYASAQYVKNDYQNYFGVGEQTLEPLRYPGTLVTYQNFDAYQDALDRVVGGRTYSQYNSYRQKAYLLDLNVERDTMGGILKPLMGVQIGYYDIGDYTREVHNGGVNQLTKLRTDYLAGRIKGFNGGWDNAVKAGLSYDTRDYAPNPSSGVLAQAIGRASLKAFGSIENYAQLKLEARGYYSPFPKKARLIMAGRVGYLAQTSDTPFYAMSLAPGVDNTATWLGGFAALQGFQNNRFVGSNVAIASAAVRWFFAESTLWKQNLSYGVTAFAESGSVFDSIGDTSFKNWKSTAGVGFILTWNVATIVSFDLGASKEGTLFYMGMGLPF